MGIEIFAEIHGIKYKPFLCSNLKTYPALNIEEVLKQHSNFIINFDTNVNFAVSHWVSPKRTRSYPYARVYNTLASTIKKITIIPVLKDEGIDGDRDFLQWDTVSLMSLLNVYVILAYYTKAIKNNEYANKITSQQFDCSYIKKKIEELATYQSDALHWNLYQLQEIKSIGLSALESYSKISNNLNVKLHNLADAEKRFEIISKDIVDFKYFSRDLAEKAQNRETKTLQPKEFIEGEKGKITIKNYLGGYYYFTCDEVSINENTIILKEAKHSSNNKLPSLDDIKDGLLKMILYSNLVNVNVAGKMYVPKPVLKLTSLKKVITEEFSSKQKTILDLLLAEAKFNGFSIENN